MIWPLDSVVALERRRKSSSVTSQPILRFGRRSVFRICCCYDEVYAMLKGRDFSPFLYDVETL